MKSQMINKHLEVKKSRTGKGIFATKDFKEGEVVFEIKGVFRSGDVDEIMDDKTRDNMFRFDKSKYLSPEGGLGAFLNHSCDPNTKIVKRQKKLFVVAIKDIKPGEHITFDYSTVTASDDCWEMKCNCGARNCRKKIREFSALPKKLQQKYIDEKIVPSYILSV